MKPPLQDTIQLSALRRFLLWLFQAPGSPYVVTNSACDFSEARAYLDGLSGQQPAIAVQHLLLAAIARTLKKKSLLRSTGARTMSALEDAVDNALDSITPTNARNWFRHCGYAPP